MRVTTLADRAGRVHHSVQRLGQRAKAAPHHFLGANPYCWETIEHGGALLVCSEHGLACSAGCPRTRVGIVLDGGGLDRVVVHVGVVAVDIRGDELGVGEVVFANEEGCFARAGRAVAISVGRLPGSHKTLVYGLQPD
jgi:hypothetical protein